MKLFIKLSLLLLLCFECVLCYYNTEHFQRDVHHLEAQVGLYVVFDCDLDFPTELKIPYILKWSKDEKQIFSWYEGAFVAPEEYIGRLSLVDNNPNYGSGSINLTSIRESDAGLYECKVYFPNRTPSLRNNGTLFHLAIDSGALIKIPPINQTILEGDKALLQCVMKYPDISKVSWYKDGEDLMNLKDLVNRAHLEIDGSLLITTTVMSDLGEYECVVQDLGGEKQHVKAFLNVQYKAKVIYSPPEVYFSYGKPGLLNCHFRANPPLKTLRWEKDGFLYEASNVPGVELAQNGSLFFRNVDEPHAGLYSCTPYNDLGTAGPSTLINVIVQHPPWFTIKPQSRYYHKLGEDVVFHCDAQDKNRKHRPDITWSRKDGTQLPFDRVSYDGGNMTIERIRETDRGIYKCAAHNEAATITVETELNIANIPPHPPYNLSANSTDTEVTLSWEPGSFSLTSKYAVWFRLTDIQEWRMVQAFPEKNEVTLRNLEPGREYEFMVLCSNSHGDGMFSKTFRYFTRPNDFNDPEQFQDPNSIEAFSQIGPPQTLVIEEIDDGYLAKWESPLFGLENLKHYILRWYIEPDHIFQGSYETEDRFFIIQNLNEDEMYSFQVSAMDHNNYEVHSNFYEIMVPPYRRKKAIAIGTITGIIFIVVCVAVILYSKKKWFLRRRTSTDTKY